MPQLKANASITLLHEGAGQSNLMMLCVVGGRVGQEDDCAYNSTTPMPRIEAILRKFRLPIRKAASRTRFRFPRPVRLRCSHSRGSGRSRAHGNDGRARRAPAGIRTLPRGNIIAANHTFFRRQTAVRRHGRRTLPPIAAALNNGLPAGKTDAHFRSRVCCAATGADKA